MKIGIISDSHDHLPNVRTALARFKQAGVEHVLHAGDFCSPFVWIELRNAGIPTTAVFGNNDGEWLFLVKLAKGIGEMRKGPIEFALGGKKIALMHEPVYLDALADSGHFDLIVYGHTHDVDQRRRGKALILNPGESCGYLRQKSTALICDLADFSVETVSLDSAPGAAPPA